MDVPTAAPIPRIWRTQIPRENTYAAQALMAGANPAYIVRQLGHSMAQMVFKVYARWLDGADWGREAAKLEAALSQNYPKE